VNLPRPVFRTPGEAVHNQACPACLGSGDVYSIRTNGPQPCRYCNGDGTLDSWRRTVDTEDP